MLKKNIVILFIYKAEIKLYILEYLICDIEDWIFDQLDEFFISEFQKTSCLYYH